MPGPKGVPRADIVALLAEGLPDKRIAQILHTGPMRVRRIRRELELPRYERTFTTIEQAWTDRTRPTDDGHLAWSGFWRESVHPVFKHQGTEHSARRVAFRLTHGREPEGHVMAGCGWPPCVKPEHVEDQPMRDQLRSQCHLIFGTAA